MTHKLMATLPNGAEIWRKSTLADPLGYTEKIVFEVIPPGYGDSWAVAKLGPFATMREARSAAKDSHQRSVTEC